MTESTVPRPRGWRYGVHPGADGLQVRSLGRVDLPLGEALRVEMVNADTPGEDIVHLQYYVSTEMGAWALWLSCPRSDLASREEVLRVISPPYVEP